MELASERTNFGGRADRGPMPGRLRAALIVLVFQALANGFAGWLIIDSINEEASHGESTDGTGLLSFLGYFSIVAAVVLLACVVFTVRPKSWVRPVVIVIETIVIISDLVNLVNGSLAGVVGMILAIAVIVIVAGEDARDWFSREQW